MEFDFLYLNEKSAFWEDYHKLWQRSNYSSPFNSSGFLKILCSEYKNNHPKVFYIINDKNILAAAFFRIYNGKLIFLSDGHTDHNIIAWDSSISEKTKIDFLSYIIKQCNIPLFLKNVPPWVEDLNYWEWAGRNNKKVISFKAWQCPTVENNDSAFNDKEFLISQFKKSRLQTYFNKIKRLPGFELRIDQTATDDLKNWIDNHCLNHETRWNNTDTPSNYINRNVRNLLFKKVLNWHSEELCVRFTVFAENKHIASVICLQERKRLIYSLPSYLKKYENTHVSQVLVSYIGQWAAEKEYTVFDFGVGAEEYKLRFANKIHFVNRIYIYKTKFSSFYFKGLLDKLSRENSTLKSFWSVVGLNLFRSKLIPLKNRVINKSKRFISEYLKNYKLGLKKLLSKLQSKNEYYYGAINQQVFKLNEDIKIRELSSYEVLDFLSNQVDLSPIQRSNYIDIIGNKIRTPYGLFENNLLIQISWLKKGTEHEVENHLRKTYSLSEIYTIMDCYTDKNHRGKGYYTLMLKFLTSQYDEKTYYIIYTDNWNIASQKGIVKAGFVKIIEKRAMNKGNNIKWRFLTSE
jgi:hypothetical protein